MSETDVGFEQEALSWLDDVYRFSLSLTGDRADAEDLVEDTYARAYRSWHTFQRGGDARRWLFTICRNAFLSMQDRADEPCNAIERLPEPFRSVVVLVDVEDQSYESAAAVLGLTIDTVRSRLFRARRQLRRTIPSSSRSHSNACPS